MLKSKIMADKVENLRDLLGLLNNHCFQIFKYQVRKNFSGIYELTVSEGLTVRAKADTIENLYKNILKMCYEKNYINMLGYVIIDRQKYRQK